MRINRHNYEEFFILYLDNELNASDRKMVEEFVSQHPDLREELELLSQFRLQPDPELVFPDKTQLLKAGDISTEDMLLYLDGELKAEEAFRTRQIIESSQSLQKEFNLYERTRLEAPHIPCPNRELLYKKEERAVMFHLSWRRIAAGVIVLLLAGSLVLLLNDRRADTDAPEIATTDLTQPAPEEKTPVVADPVAPREHPVPALADNGNTEKALAKEAENNRSAGSPDPVIAAQAKIEEKTSVPSNNLPVMEENRPAIAFTEPVKRNDPEYDFSNTRVTSTSPHPSNIQTVAYTPTDIETDDQEPADGKNNKLRGLFRKVTRTFEKRTNIETTDEDGRLLVAGLAFKLK